jgi:hypothetical protein
VQVAIIPADISQPIRIEDVEVTLDQLQKAVGGDIQVVGLRELSMNMYLNEEGKFGKFAPNSRATTLGHEYRAIRQDDHIVGDVVLLGPFDEEGEDTGLSPEQIAWLTAADQNLGLLSKRD